mmetsp:Transcript_113109/g.365387  ORF Transcript_113109/g.365387 Transcript_113109/m.365387 type:complete len:1094 (-) Transcript_113109:57-3338(-)
MVRGFVGEELQHDAEGQGSFLLPHPPSRSESRQNPAPRSARPTRRALAVLASCSCAAVVLVALAWLRSSPASLKPSRFPLIRQAQELPLQELQELEPSGSAVPGQQYPEFSNLTEAFKALDTDGDGFVTMNKTGVPTPTSLKQFLAQMGSSLQLDGAKQTPSSVTVSTQTQLMKGIAKMSMNLTQEPMRLKPGARRMDEGYVSELFTFGAPGTAVTPLYDAKSPNGCFGGMRTFTASKRFVKETRQFISVYDPVSWVCSGVGYSHARMEYFQARESSYTNNKVYPCGNYKDEPPMDNFWWLSGHMVYPKVLWTHEAMMPAVQQMPVKTAPNDLPTFRRRLQQVTAWADLTPEQKVIRTAMMSHFSFMAYWAPQLASVDAPDWGWEFVGHACSVGSGGSGGVMGMNLGGASDLGRTVESFVDSCGDNYFLYQHPQNLECILAIEGSANLLDWLSDLNFGAKQFCGFGQVHGGFKAKLDRMTSGIDFYQAIRQQLPMCSKVSVTAHSLGGGIAELFTACANKDVQHNESGFVDYRLTSFVRGPPKRIAPFYADKAAGSFLRNRATSMCLDVQGTLATNFHTKVILYNCEFPNSTFTKDQKWQWRNDGSVVNVLSGLCVDGQGGHLFQRTCQPSSSSAQQVWELTPEGFMKSTHSGLCVNNSLGLQRCPYTDQEWELTPTGFLLNKVSNKCLDVAGMPGTAKYSNLVLWDCEYNLTNTDQKWEFTETGALRNKLSQLCAAVNAQPGRSPQPNLVLGDCDLAWNMTGTGFLVTARSGWCMNVQGSPGVANGLNVNVRVCQQKFVETTALWKRMPEGFLRNIGRPQMRQGSDRGSGGMFRCLNVFGEPWNMTQKKADGARLFLDVCETNTDQRWQIAGDGPVKNVIGMQKCLGVNTRNGPFGTPWIDNCMPLSDRSLYLDFKWNVNASTASAGYIKSRELRKCLDVLPGMLSTKAQVKLCNASASQHFRLNADGNIVSDTTGQCLTMAGETMPLALETCSATDAQQWTHTQDGFLVNKQNGQCIATVAEHGQVHYIYMRPCPQPTQQWELTPDGMMRNKITNHCIDMPSAQASTPWWQLVMSPCDPQRNQQKWDQVNF